jgi:hypothetical protein
MSPGALRNSLVVRTDDDSLPGNKRPIINDPGMGWRFLSLEGKIANTALILFIKLHNLAENPIYRLENRHVSQCGTNLGLFPDQTTSPFTKSVKCNTRLETELFPFLSTFHSVLRKVIAIYYPFDD